MSQIARITLISKKTSPRFFFSSFGRMAYTPGQSADMALDNTCVGSEM